jgi:hypothetical protein
MVTTQVAATTAAAAAAIILAAPAQAVPVVGGNGLTPNAWALVEYIQANYSGVQSIGGVRQDPYPDHPSGRAVDIMCGANTALCDTIAADIRSQSASFGVTYILWQTAGHYDHVHVSVA